MSGVSALRSLGGWIPGGTGPADRESVISPLLRLNQLALEHEQILELEINPLRVMPDRGGSLALDVRRLQSSSESPTV